MLCLCEIMFIFSSESKQERAREKEQKGSAKLLHINKKNSFVPSTLFINFIFSLFHCRSLKLPAIYVQNYRAAIERLQKIHQILIFSLYTAFFLFLSFLGMCIIVDFLTSLSLKWILIYEAFFYQ